MKILDSYINEQKGVQIQEDRLVASEFIKGGSTILVQPPLASVPLPAKRHQRCNYCLRKAQLQCCSRCRSAYFCSNECFRNAWLHFHRVLCEPQETDIYKDVDADRWLLERTALTLHSHARLNKQYSHSPTHLPYAIHALQLHTPTSCTTSDYNQSTVDAVAQFLEPFDCQISSEELSVLWKRIQVCSFPILDPDQQLEPVAVGVYPITSLFVGHSCRPNAAVIYKQGTQSIITLEDILPGESITIAYVDLISTKEQRWTELRKKFGQDYKCDCIRCQGDLALIDTALEKGESLGLTADDGRKLLSENLLSWSILDMLRDAEVREKDSWSPIQVLEPPQFTHFVSRIAFPTVYYASIDDKKHHNSPSLYKAYVKEDRAHIIQRLPAAMTALLNVPQVPAFTIATIRAAESLLLEHIAEGNWVKTSRCALYLFVIYRVIYPPFHPKLSYHTLILARSGWNALVEMELIGMERKLERIYANGTRTWIELAKDAIDTTFGRESNFWRDIIELQWVYDREQKVKGAC
ncbi:hypothetical protein BDF21DRAFT_431770 [Thamnidium elegans]|uniref:MYND-type domain-containing protein n=1 Tax=Thamnidium elegans TaxID=101142 RepID=A0A8H7VPY4_9FUNG|nr:hypothetical protein INT48_008786 [Thamnidium elegans]KAI8052690.1 hypothetical protein BDF21DRAFT_431770 [Thamnidium elegans]